jgi:hypothetical protein
MAKTATKAARKAGERRVKDWACMISFLVDGLNGGGVIG